MVRFEHKSFTFFQVDRPVVAGGDSFVRRLQELSPMLGSVTTTALTQTVLTQRQAEDAEVLESKITTRPLDEPLLDVFRRNELRYVLYRRVVQSENMKSFLLNAMESKADHEPEFFERVYGSKDNTDNDHYQTVVCDSVDYFDDLAYGKTLALVPEDNGPAALKASQFQDYCRRTFDAEAPELGKDSVSESGIIPVATLAQAVNETAAERFLEVVNKEILPIKVAIGGVQAYRSFSLSSDLRM